jgi:hypothetical protein
MCLRLGTAAATDSFYFLFHTSFVELDECKTAAVGFQGTTDANSSTNRCYWCYSSADSQQDD